MDAKRGTFGNRFGVIAAVAGSAVGLGNIWRFPYVAGENGGAAFIVVYLLICLLIAIPVMLSEFSIGRYGRKSAIGSFRILTKNKSWHSIGYLSILSAMFILSFYSVIAGWTLDFIKESAVNGFADKDSAQIAEQFDNFVNSTRPIWWTLGFLFINCVIVTLGVEKGIERYSKFLMPLLVVMLLGLSVNSVFMPGFTDAVKFLFKPDLSKITWNVILQALGQSFFSMSIGMGAMITYGSYIKDKENLYSVGGTVAIADVFIAFLAGLAIFPAVFTFNISPTSGSELVFLTLPSVFAQMTGGYVISTIFFLLLFFAAVTSSFSLLEVVVAYLTEEFNIKRIWANLVSFVVIGFLSVLCTLSLRAGSGIRVAGKSMFDFFDYFSSNFMLPVGGLAIIIFVGWFMNKKIRYNQLTTGGLYGRRLYTVVLYLIKYVIPVAIIIMFLNLNFL